MAKAADALFSLFKTEKKPLLRGINKKNIPREDVDCRYVEDLGEGIDDVDVDASAAFDAPERPHAIAKRFRQIILRPVSALP